MKLLIFFSLCCASSSFAQFNNGFPYGRITYDELLMKSYPATYEVDDMPKSSALALPQNGGHYLFNISNPANKITLTSIINLSKVVYSSVEYHTLKELFNRIIDTHQSQIVFKKK